MRTWAGRVVIEDQTKERGEREEVAVVVVVVAAAEEEEEEEDEVVAVREAAGAAIDGLNNFAGDI